MTPPMGKDYRFEEVSDFDIDSAAFTVGVERFPLGPAGPCIRINTGALELIIRGHFTDIDAMIEGLEKVRKRLAKLNKKWAGRAALGAQHDQG